jgi:hypothetical protein
MKTLGLIIVAVDFALALLIALRYLKHRRETKQEREIKRASATAIMRKEYARVSALRSFRRRLHRAIVWKTIGTQPAVARLPRRVRRQAMRNTANHMFRVERGLLEVTSKSHLRRAIRGYIDPSLFIPAAKT